MKRNYMSARQQRRAHETKIKEGMKFRKIVPANAAFNRIKTNLISFGWILHEEHNNLVITENKYAFTTSPALKLFTEMFHVTLIPHSEGIEISRLEVYENYRCNGCAGNLLKSILQFLLQHEVDDIFLIPLPAGDPEKFSFTNLDDNQLEQFYHRRGFRKIRGNKYWKLENDEFLNYTGHESVNLKWIKSTLDPIHPNVFIGDTLHWQTRSIPIKMKIYNRA